mmetsp:Transcript_27064/g.40839  ORF Transcript_27064/g.40839 Transcript_27064/m.40839 type:complete len:109 (-) Transcript_27064:372-698(-)
MCSMPCVALCFMVPACAWSIARDVAPPLPAGHRLSELVDERPVVVARSLVVHPPSVVHVPSVVTSTLCIGCVPHAHSCVLLLQILIQWYTPRNSEPSQCQLQIRSRSC